MSVIPAFDGHGVLPAIRPGAPGHSPDRSPYAADMLSFCQRFGTSGDRRTILRGLLELRGELLGIGLGGFQWVDGSFVEDVEALRGRPPADIDVVSFLDLGDQAAQLALVASHQHLFDPRGCKARYLVDHYAISTSSALDEKLARKVGYWYSMWSHQRDSDAWKGFVSVPLESNDADALAWIAAQEPAGGQP